MIKSDYGRLALKFKWQGQYRTVYLGLDDNRENRRVANNLDRTVAAEILTGTFKPAERFPDAKWVRELAAESKRSAVPTLGEFTKLWIEECKVSLKSQTLYGYEHMLDRHLLPHSIASRAINEVTESAVKAFLRHLLDTDKLVGDGKLSRRTVNMVIARLRTIFKAAARRYRFDDPMRYVDNVQQPKARPNPLKLEEVRALLGATDGWFKNFLSVLIFTGMRPNEALALRWKDIDWAHGLILVCGNVTDDGEIEDTLKTEGSNREVEMMEVVRIALERQQALVAINDPELLVFPSADGTPRRLNNIRKREWAAALAAAGIEERVIYQCRHTYAALSLEFGDTVQHVAAQLGHNSIKMVVDVYSRWKRRPESAALQRFDEALRLDNTS